MKTGSVIYGASRSEIRENLKVLGAKMQLFVIFILCGSVFAADEGFLQSTIRDHFSVNRHHSANPDNKQAVLDFIRAQFTGYGLETELETFTHYNPQISGNFTNVIGVKKGSNYGSADDRVVGLGAHYDTVDTTSGVDDNGSGMAAMLHVMRHFHTSGGRWKHTMVFVAFDAEELGLAGSRQFVTGWWRNFIQDTGVVNPSGFIILDTIMNYNTSANSQTVPPNLEQGFPAATNSINSDGRQGDFTTLIYRSTTGDVDLATSFNSSWRTGQQTEHEIETIGIPTSNLMLIYNYFSDLTRSDHLSFWEGGFPAIFVTDTAEHRGNMRACYHHPCDNLPTMLTDNNIRFLGKISDTLAATMDKLAVPDGSPSSGAPPSLFFSLRAWILRVFSGLYVTV